MRNWSQYTFRLAVGLGIFLGVIYAGHRALTPDFPLVGVIQWTREIKAFEDSLQGVMEGLREEGYQDGLNMRLEVCNARGERDEAAAAAWKFQEKGARLLITNGTVPTQITLEVLRDRKTPIVYTNVGCPNATGLSRPAAPEAVRFTGASMEVPIIEQLRFLIMARPQLRRLGILFCSASSPAEATGNAAAEASPGLGLIPILRTVPDECPEPLMQTVNDLIDEKIEALFIPTDTVLVQPRNLRIICQAATRAGIPVMAPEGDSVAYGALLSYHCDFAEVGRQSGRQAARLLSGVPIAQILPESPHIKKLTLNLKVAQGLNLFLPRHLLYQAYQLY